MKSLSHSAIFAFALLAASLPSHSDTLADIYELSLKNDPSLKAAQANYRADIETEKQALSSLLPQINASIEYSESDQESYSERILDLGIPGAPETTVTSNQIDTERTTYTASLNQTLFDLNAWFNFKSGKKVTRQAESQLAYEQQNLIVRVAEAYFDVLRAIDNLEASKAEERATQRQLEQTQQRFDVGLIAITDVHEARAVFDSTVVLRLTDEGKLGTAYESLIVLTGQSHANLWMLSKDFPVIDPSPMARDEWVNFALQNNNSLKAATFATQAAHQSALSKKMNHAPKVTGSITYTDNSDEGDNTNQLSNALRPFESDSETTSWGIKLTVPIYSGGGVSSQRRQAYELYNVALQTSIDTQRKVIRNTRASHITVVTDVQRVKARQQAIVSTSSALEATQAGYEVGTRNIVDVLQSQRSLYNSIRDYANSRYDYVLNLMKLKQAAGTLSPQDLLDINQWLVAPGAVSSNEYQTFLEG